MYSFSYNRLKVLQNFVSVFDKSANRLSTVAYSSRMSCHGVMAAIYVVLLNICPWFLFFFPLPFFIDLSQPDGSHYYKMFSLYVYAPAYTIYLVVYTARVLLLLRQMDAVNLKFNSVGTRLGGGAPPPPPGGGEGWGVVFFFVFDKK